MTKLTWYQYDILDYTMNRAANRHFLGDSENMRVLVGLGLMKSVGHKSFVKGEYFEITRAGCKALEGESI